MIPLLKNAFSVNVNTKIKKHLVLAPDGTLYTATANNLLAITPTKVSVDNLSIAKTTVKTNTVYRATNNIRVEGFELQASVNTIFSSGKTISFKKGFRVKRGASLRCKTGY